MRPVRRILATALALTLLAALSHLPWGRPPEAAVLRLSWRTNGEKIKVPRQQDANLPAHMRLPEDQAFDVKIRPYRLVLKVDGQLLLDQPVVAPGWRHDRPLSVLQEVPLTPGRHAVEANFIPQGLAEPEPFRTQAEFRPGRVVLLTLDESGAWEQR